MNQFIFHKLAGEHYVQSINLFDGMLYPIPGNPKKEDFVRVASEMGYVAPTPIAWILREAYYAWRKRVDKFSAGDWGKSHNRATVDAA